MSEHRLQMAVASYLGLVMPPNAYWTAVDAGQGRMDIRAAQLRKMRGVKAGVPDIIVVWQGFFLGIELKDTKGRLSDKQEASFAHIKAAGALVCVCRSVADVERALIHMGVTLRGTTLSAAERDARLAAAPKITRSRVTRTRATPSLIARGNRASLVGMK